MNLLYTITLLLVTVSLAQESCDNMIPDLSYQISGRKLKFPCDSTQSIYTTTGRYIPKNVIATRIQIYRDEAIVSLPRYRHGVPFSLARFPLRSKGCLVELVPFPCWPMQEEGNCEALQSVVDIFLDEIDVLWVLDSGVVNTLDQPIKRCSPKVVAINMKTGQVVKILDLSKLVHDYSRLQYLVVDYSEHHRPYVYIADAGSASIIVYDVIEDKGYRVILPGKIAATQRDVLYMVLVRNNGNSIFFSYLSSPKLYSIKTIHLQTGQAVGAIVEVGAKPEGVHTVILGTDNGAGIFFRNKGESDVYIWNSELCYKPENFILVQRGNDCRLTTQVVPGYKRLMWGIESNFHHYISNTMGSLGASIVVHPLIKTGDA